MMNCLLAWSTLIKDLLLGGAAVVTAGCAVAGLQTWRRQLRGAAEYDLARRLLRAAFAVRDAVTSARSTGIGVSEMREALIASGVGPEAIPLHLPPNDDTEMMIAVYSQRWSRVGLAMSELQVPLLEAEVLWGAHTKAVFGGLEQCARRLRWAFTMFARQRRRALSGQAGAIALERQQEIDGIRDDSAHEGGEDPFAKSLEEAMTALETFVRPHLSR